MRAIRCLLLNSVERSECFISSMRIQCIRLWQRLCSPNSTLIYLCGLPLSAWTRILQCIAPYRAREESPRLLRKNEARCRAMWSLARNAARLGSGLRRAASRDDFSFFGASSSPSSPCLSSRLSSWLQIFLLLLRGCKLTPRLARKL